jgi:phospholipid-binding lipoprotein MlaA
MHYSYKIFLTVALTAAITGCATSGANPLDPLESWNRDVQSFNDTVDRHVMKPVAQAYDWVMPDFAHRGVTNFFNNLDDISVIVNDVLQGKFWQAPEDTARFLLNSTLGLAGFIDIASEVDLQKHNEDFDQTLGVWGVPTGPYLVVPLKGPSSARGIVGLAANSALNPINYVAGPFISFGVGVLNAIDSRAEVLSLGNIADEAIIGDRYTFFRDSYLAQRKSLVADGIESKEDKAEFDIDKALDETLADEAKKPADAKLQPQPEEKPAESTPPAP